MAKTTPKMTPPKMISAKTPPTRGSVPMPTRGPPPPSIAAGHSKVKAMKGKP